MDAEELKIKITVDKSEFTKGIKGIEDAIGKTTSQTNSGVNSVSNEVLSAVSKIKGAVNTSLGTAIISLINTTRSQTRLLTKNLAKDTSKTFQSVKKELRTLFKGDDLLAWLYAIDSPKVKAAEDHFNAIRKELDDNGKAMLDWFIRWEIIKNRFKKQIIAPMTSALGKLKNKIKEAGWFQPILQGFTKLKTKLSTVKETVSNVFKTLGDTKFGQGIKAVCTEIGVWFKGMAAAIKTSIMGIIAYIAALVAAFALMTKLTNAVTKLGDSIDKGAQRLNMSYEQYQRWSYTLELCGSSIDELKESYNQMVSQMSQARNGTEASAQAFSDLGVNIYDVNGNLRNTADVYEDVVDSLRNIDNTSERAAKAQKLFGESASKLNPVLNLTKEQLEDIARTQEVLGGRMSDKMVKLSATYQDAITTMKQAWQGLKNTLAEAFLPTLQKVVVWLTVAIAKMNIIIKTLFGIKDDPMGDATESTNNYTKSVTKAADAVDKLKKQTFGFDEMNILAGEDSDSSDTSSLDLGLDALNDSSITGTLLPEDALADIEKFQTTMDEIGGKVAGWVTGISLLGGALLIVFGALGLNIPMVLGGVTMLGLGIAVGEASSTALSNQLDDTVGRVAAWVASLSLVIGALLAVIGLLTLDMKLIVAGVTLAAIGITVGETMGDLDAYGTKVEEIVGQVSVWVASLSLIIGALIAVIGIFTLDMKLVMAGVTLAALGITVGNSAGDMDAFGTKVSKIVNQVAGWVAAIALLAGILIAIIGFCTVNIPLGVKGLILAGMGAAIGISAGIASGTFSKWGEELGKVIDEVGAWLAQAWEDVCDFFVRLGKSIADFFVDVYNWVVEALKKCWEFIKGIPSWIYEKVLVPIGEFFSKLWDGVTTGVKNVIAKIKEIFSTIADWFNEKVIEPIKKFFSDLWDKLKTGASNAWSGIKNAFSAMGTWFSNIGSSVADVFKNAWAKIKQGASDAWTGIKNVFGTVGTFFKDTFTNAWTAVKNVFSTGGKIFDGIKDGIVTAFKAIVNTIIRGINTVITIPFNAINSALNVIRNANILGVQPFSWLPTISIPQIPQLAKGGIVDRATLAEIGENGREAVIPLENNTEWMDKLADKLAERNNTPSTLILKVGETELGRASIRGINSITKQTGSLQLQLT